MMKENYNISLIEEDDVEKFVQIFRKSFKSDYLIPSIYRGLGIDKFILSELGNSFSPYRYFGLFYNNKIVGCAEYKIIGNDTFFLNLIASDNEFKGKGVGNALFNYAVDYFSKKGFYKIQLDVYEGNDIALEWYTSLGFIELQRKYVYKVNTDIFYEKQYSIYIQNFPQYKELTKYYGFNYLDVMINAEFVRIGVIENDLIIRDEYNEYSKIAASIISKDYNFDNIYFIGDVVDDSPDLILMHKILRMELNLIK